MTAMRAFFMSSLLVGCWFFLLTLQALVYVFPFQRVLLWITVESFTFTTFRGLQHNLIFTYQQLLMARTCSLLKTRQHTSVSPFSPPSRRPQLWSGWVLYQSSRARSLPPSRNSDHPQKTHLRRVLTKLKLQSALEAFKVQLIDTRNVIHVGRYHARNFKQIRHHLAELPTNILLTTNKKAREKITMAHIISLYKITQVIHFLTVVMIIEC